MQCLLERWSKHDGGTWAPNSWTLCWALCFRRKNTARFLSAFLSYNSLSCRYKIPTRLLWKAIAFAQFSLTNGFKLQRINFSPTRAGSLHEKCENDWKNSTNSHFLRDVFLGSYGPAFFFLNFHYAPYKKSYCIDVGNPEATRKALSGACIWFCRWFNRWPRLFLSELIFHSCTCKLYIGSYL